MTHKREKSALNTQDQPIGPLLILTLGLMVGIIGGLGAVVFRAMIGFFHNVLFSGQLNFYYNTNLHATPSIWGAGIILVPVIASLLVTWLIKTFAPEAKGHGVPEVLDAIYYNQGKIRPAVAFFKSVASALSIGSGGSVGREGPIIQIGAAFGSTLGQIIKMPIRQRIMLIGAGAGAGIAATFNAPIGGLLFAVELLMVSINALSIAVVAIATITATYIGRYYLGLDPAFNIPSLMIPSDHLTQLSQLALFIPFGIIIGLAATLFTKIIYWFEDLFNALPVNDYLRHALGMLILGLIIYLLVTFSGHYYVQGVGYATIVDVLQALLTNPGFLLLLCALKLLVTSLTLGSGGSGGIFSPSLFMGATLGGAIGSLCSALPLPFDVNPVLFAVAGMAGMVSGTTGAILTATVMLFEMTRDYNAILAIILTAALAYLTRILITRESIYTLKLLRRNHLVPEGLQAALLHPYLAQQVMNTKFSLMDPEQFKKYTRVTARSKEPIILTQAGRLAGILATGSPLQFGSKYSSKRFIVVGGQMSLLTVLRQMQTSHAQYALVMRYANIENPDQLVGIIGDREIAQLVGNSSQLINEPL